MSAKLTASKPAGRTRPVGVCSTYWLACAGAVLVTLCAVLFTTSAEPRDAAQRLDCANDEALDRSMSGIAQPVHAVNLANARTTRAEQLVPLTQATAVLPTARAATLVHGSLLEPFGRPANPVARADIRFVDVHGTQRFAAFKDGRYEIAQLDFGSYWVSARAVGFRDVEQQLELSTQQPLLRYDIVLLPASELRIKVTTTNGDDLKTVLRAAAAPLGALRIGALATREALASGQAANDMQDLACVYLDHGPRTEELPAGCIGILLVNGEFPAFVSLVIHDTVLQTRSVRAGDSEIDFVVDCESLLSELATIRVQVVDAASGIGIERARVLLRGGSHSDPGVVTDARGFAAIERREPGRFELQVRALGYERLRQPMDALPKRVTDLGVIALEREITIEGKILDDEDRGLAASFRLGVIDPLDRSLYWFRGEAFKSSAGGEFKLTGLGRREYVISTSNHDTSTAPDWEAVAWVCANVIVDTRGGPVSGLEIRLQKPSKLVLRAQGSAAATKGFRVADEQGLELVRGRFEGPLPRALNLSAGNYLVSLLDGDVLRFERALVLGEETVLLDIDTPR